MKASLSLPAILFVCGLGFFIQGQQDNPTRADLRIRTAPGNPTKIQNLAVRITTSKARGAGTDNAVYFDVGPLAWRLNQPHHNDFESGTTDTYLLVQDGVVLNSKPPQKISLTTADILWLRLHKKGTAGVTGTRDGFYGAWHPKTITLIVNGADYQTAQVDPSLNSKCWYWRSLDPDDSDLEIFARSLRMQPNKGLNALDKVAGILTTNLFKRLGISGWLHNPTQRECSGIPAKRKPSRSLPAVCATGDVTYVGSSTDGLETIDLRLRKVEPDAIRGARSSEVTFDEKHGFVQPRYIRVENSHAHRRARVGQVARICGNVKWDTDREGWWEIHPRNSSDLPRASK